MIVTNMFIPVSLPKVVEGVGWVLGGGVDRVRLIREVLERAVEVTPFFLPGMVVVHPAYNEAVEVVEEFEEGGVRMLRVELEVEKGIMQYEILPACECAAFEVFMALYSQAEARLN